MDGKTRISSEGGAVKRFTMVGAKNHGAFMQETAAMETKLLKSHVLPRRAKMMLLFCGSAVVSGFIPTYTQPINRGAFRFILDNFKKRRVHRGNHRPESSGYRPVPFSPWTSYKNQ